MPTRIVFMGGTFILSDAGTFKGQSGDMISLDAAVVINGVGKTSVRLPIDVVEAIISLAKDERYKDFKKRNEKK